MLQSEHIYIRGLERGDAKALQELRVRNRAFLQPFEPVQTEESFTLAAVEESLRNVVESREQKLGYGNGIFLRRTDELIGRVNLSNVVYGARHNCTIGYFLDQQHNGKGYMTEAVKLAVQMAFEQVGLHRVQAGVMPRNVGSIRVVEKAGFRYEGLSKWYLKINGVWEDHNIYAITTEEWSK